MTLLETSVIAFAINHLRTHTNWPSRHHKQAFYVATPCKYR